MIVLEVYLDWEPAGVRRPGQPELPRVPYCSSWTCPCPAYTQGAIGCTGCHLCTQHRSRRGGERYLSGTRIARRDPGHQVPIRDRGSVAIVVQTCKPPYHCLRHIGPG